jgi:hypothetical protein
VSAVNSSGCEGSRFELSFNKTDFNPENTISLDKSVVCSEAENSVVISGIEEGITYIVSLNGEEIYNGQSNEASIELTLAENEIIGENTIDVDAVHPVCGSVNLVSELTYEKLEEVEISVANSNVESCNGENVTLEASSNFEAVVYTWFDVDMNVIQSGASHLVMLSGLTGSTDIFVQAETAGGCISEMESVFVEYIDLPQAEISFDEEQLTLTSNFEAGNQWYFNGELLDTNDQVISISEAGVYKLIVESGSCSTEDELEVSVITGINDLTVKELEFYPNPVRDRVTITFEEDFKIKSAEDIQVFDISGARIYGFKIISLAAGSIQLDLTSFDNGMYMILIQNGNTVYRLKNIIKN